MVTVTTANTMALMKPPMMSLVSTLDCAREK